MICKIQEQYNPRWDGFVDSQPDATFFHLWKWREVLQQSFNYEPFYLAVEENGEIQGALPLFLVKSYLFGRSMVAMPLAVYGGIIAKNQRAVDLLLQKAVELAQSHKARYLEIRGNPYSDRSPEDAAKRHFLACKQKDLYVTFLGPIDPEDDANLARIPRKQRRMVRQGEKHGLKFVAANHRLREFYEVYAASVRNLGTPVYSMSYFECLLRAFPEECRVFLVEHQDKVVAGVLTFFFKDQVMPYYGGALKEYFNFAPNDFMYWELMRFGAANGYKTFDFGRSKEGTGSYNFKRHWGFEARPLPYWCFSLDGRAIPDTSPLNPKFQWAIRVWRGLPLRLTMALGPHIVRHIP
jgi:FemAB-related protein (PEP-CTERM system-associated)